MHFVCHVYRTYGKLKKNGFQAKPDLYSCGRQRICAERMRNGWKWALERCHKCVFVPRCIQVARQRRLCPTMLSDICMGTVTERGNTMGNAMGCSKTTSYIVIIFENPIVFPIVFPHGVTVTSGHALRPLRAGFEAPPSNKALGLGRKMQRQCA